jgi:hypothetical protein
MKELELFFEYCCKAVKIDLSSKKRDDIIAFGRFVYFYNAKKMFPTISNAKIGSLAGGRDSATVTHGIKRYGELKGDFEFESIKKAIEEQLEVFDPNLSGRDLELKYLYSNKKRLEKQVEILNKRIANTEVEREILDMFNKIPTERLIHFKEHQLKAFYKMNAL